MAATIDALKAPDSKLAREITELVRDTETPLLFHHSSRVYHWGALTGRRRGLRFDHELLYAGAMFHDMGHLVVSEEMIAKLRQTYVDFCRQRRQ